MIGRRQFLAAAAATAAVASAGLPAQAQAMGASAGLGGAAIASELNVGGLNTRPRPA